jgi:hypothetical protein
LTNPSRHCSNEHLPLENLPVGTGKLRYMNASYEIEWDLQVWHSTLDRYWPWNQSTTSESFRCWYARHSCEEAI